MFHFLTDFPAKHKDISFMILSYAIYSIGGALFWAAIAILSETSFLLSPFYIGLVMASIGVVYIISDGPIGVSLDYIGYKRGAVIGVALAGVTALITIVQPSLPWFIVAVAFFALSWNVFTHALSAYILYNVSKQYEGRAFGLSGSLYNFGSFVGTLFIGRIAFWGFQNVGIFFALMVALSFLMVVFLVAPEKRNYDKSFWHALKLYWQGPSQWKRGFEAMKEFSPISWVTAFDGFVGYAYSSMLWFVIPLSITLFANPFLPEGLAIGIFDFTGIIFVAVGGYLADKFSRKKLFLRLLFFMAIGTAFLGFAPNFFVFLLLAFVVAALDDISGTAVDAMMADVDKTHDKDATIYGFTGIFTDIGFVIGPIVGGLLLAAFGLKGVFIFLGLLLLADWVFGAVALRNYKDGGGVVKRKVKFSLGGAPQNPISQNEART